LTYLKYKAEWYGRTFIPADRFFPSSKLCHRCGHKNEDLALHDRTCAALSAASLTTETLTLL